MYNYKAAIPPSIRLYPRTKRGVAQEDSWEQALDRGSHHLPHSCSQADNQGHANLCQCD